MVNYCLIIDASLIKMKSLVYKASATNLGELGQMLKGWKTSADAWSCDLVYRFSSKISA